MSFKKKTTLIIGVLCVVLAGGILLANQSTATPMKEEQVQTKDIKTYYSFSGDVKAKKSQNIYINSESEIKDILIKEGDSVKEDSELFKLSSDSVIKSNIDGEVAEILVHEGAKYSSGTHIATIVNYDKLQIEIKVDEYETNAINVGDTVDVYINALDKTIEGKIVNLSKNANIVNDVAYFKGIVEIEDNEDILVGMSVEVKALKDSVKEAKTISMSSLEFDSENQPYVYVKDANGKIIEKSVSIGINDGFIVEIKSGLKANDTILASDNLELFNPFEMMQSGGN